MGVAIAVLLATPSQARAQYSVEPQGSTVRGNFWIGEGIVGVFSPEGSAGNRLRAGVELDLGDDYEFILGVVFLDRIGSGETSASVGDISRRAMDFELGYFLVPDRLWVMYSLALEDLSGSAIIGTVSPVGHQLSVGYRFYSDRKLNLALEAAYLYVPSYSASTYDFTTQASGSAMFPVANVWSLNFRVGFDFGGR
jgi:hypothetical protein